jgi:hypothetical protein
LKNSGSKNFQVKMFGIKEPPGLGIWKQIGIQRTARSGYFKNFEKLPGFMKEPAKDPAGLGGYIRVVPPRI